MHIQHPSSMRSVALNYIVLAVAMLFEGAAWLFAFREFSRVKGEQGYIEAVKQGKDPTMFVVLFEDSAAMIGLLIAFAGIFIAQQTGNPVYDGIASILIGLVLAATAIWMVVETKGLLIGESADKEIVAGIRKILHSNPDIVFINEVLTMHMGPEYILVNISIDFRDDSSAGTVESNTAALNKKLKSVFPTIKRVFLEVETRKAHEER